MAKVSEPAVTLKLPEDDVVVSPFASRSRLPEPFTLSCASATSVPAEL